MSAPAYFNDSLVERAGGTLTADLCIYGATSAGIIAAVQAVRMGRSVVLLNPGRHLGGLSAGGLGCTDTGRAAAIGGLSREFYRRVGAHYHGDPALVAARELPAGMSGPEEWRFEPHVASLVFSGLLAAHGVTVHHGRWLATVERDGPALRALTMLGVGPDGANGLVVRARMFIDATYEGDLLAMAGVSFTVGREGNAAYDETLNGVQVRNAHQFDRPVDPWREPGRPDSGLLPGIDPAPLGEPGSGDRRVQAYNFRVCLTDDATNHVPFPRPAGYDPLAYELLARHIAAGWSGMFGKFDRLCVRSKTDTNNHGAQSTDFIGGSDRWPEAGYAERERIFQAHVTYQQGYHWFLANDPQVPPAIREHYRQWGLAADEFAATGHWPPQLYVREARRMVAEVVVTEHDCRQERAAPDPVGLGSYNMDSHNCRRFVRDGRVSNEGDVQVGSKPYGISWRAIIPRRAECTNLLVPLCCSASHIAYGSLRMEPVFMVLAQSAATAACLAIDRAIELHDLPYPALRARLLADGQVLEWPG